MIAIIAAMSKNHVIGNQGKIPWRIKGEQKRFKELTTGNTVIMGKRSFEEIGRPLPNRETIVISSTMTYEADNCRTAVSLKEALSLAGASKVFIAGGEQLYREALPLADILYITEIDMVTEGDTYFPEFNQDEFIVTNQEYFEGELPYRYLTYERRKPDNCIARQEELSIRSAAEDDAERLCRWWNDGKVMAHAGLPNGLGTNIAEVMELLREGDRDNRILIIEINQTAVGEMNYRIEDKTAEIGIKICEFSYQGKSYGTNALKLLINYLFYQRDVDKIILDTNLKNTRAQHVYENIGFTRVRVNMDAWKDQLGDWQSSVDYELLKENYDKMLNLK